MTCADNTHLGVHYYYLDDINIAKRFILHIRDHNSNYCSRAAAIKWPKINLKEKNSVATLISICKYLSPDENW